MNKTNLKSLEFWLERFEETCIDNEISMYEKMYLLNLIAKMIKLF